MDYYNNHYKKLAREVQDFSQKWELNGTEHSFLKYVSRCYYKDYSQALTKADWFYNGETKNGTITREAVRVKSREFRNDLLLYVIENDLTEWQCDALFSFFKRKFRETDVALELGKAEFNKLRENNEVSSKIDFSS